MFFDPPPAGRYDKIAIHHSDSATTCKRYAGDGDMGNNDHQNESWFVDIYLTGGSTGTYSVGIWSMSHPPANEASVMLYHDNPTTTDSYPALSATVVVGQPTGQTETGTEDWLPVTVDAYFPRRAWINKRYFGGKTPNGSAHTECAWVDETGNTSSCVPSVPGKTCCFDKTSERIRVTTTFQARFCAAMCSFLNGFLNYCLDLGQ